MIYFFNWVKLSAQRNKMMAEEYINPVKVIVLECFIN